MLFNSTVFLFVFLPFTLLAYCVAPKFLRNLLLVIASLLFYAWGELDFVLLLIISIVVNYAFALLIDFQSQTKSRLALLWLGILIDVSMLGYFKYAGFFSQTTNQFLGTSLNFAHVHLPIGISFFTFQCMSYLTDVYRRKLPARKNFIDVALYISLFPQLVAGPIVRYSQIAAQIVDRPFGLANIEKGSKRFIVGLAKKVLIADTIAILPDIIFALEPASLNSPVAWLGATAYALQIYFDFSGYSDMAIGLGTMFGFKIPENFRYPYIAASATDFWRRWHISLTNWFKDYIYIPLGGNRGSLVSTTRNILIVFAISGLWHGANWTFVSWGTFYGVLIAMEKIWKHWKLPTYTPLGHVYLLFAMIVAWAIFRSPDLLFAMTYVKAMLNVLTATSLNEIAMYLDLKILAVLLIGLLWSTPLFQRAKQLLSSRFGSNNKLIFLTDISHLILLILCITQVAISTYTPFIYFQF